MLFSKQSASRILGTSTLLVGSLFASGVNAEAPGGPDCGWGNMMFEGDSGKGAHFSAYLFNGSSGNAWIGMLLGTNGCSSEGELTYGGSSTLAIKGFLDEVAVDIAQGEGEALEALSIVLGIQKQDRPAFNSLMQENFDRIFPNENIESDAVLANIQDILKESDKLQRYAS